MIISTCAECRFFDAWSPAKPSEHGGIMGSCKARAPKLIEHLSEHGRVIPVTKFAAVSSTAGACGEGRPRANLQLPTANLAAATPPRRVSIFRGLAKRWLSEQPVTR